MLQRLPSNPRLCIGSHSGKITQVCMTPDNAYIVSASVDKTVRITSMKDRSFREIHFQHEVHCACSTPDGQHVVCGTGDGSISVACFRTAKVVSVIHAHTSCVNSVCMTKNGSHIVSGSDDMDVWVTDWRSRKDFLLRRHTHSVVKVCMTSDDKSVVSVSHDGIVCITRIHDRLVLHNIKLSRFRDRHNCHGITCLHSLCITPDGTRILIGLSNRDLCVINVQTGRCVLEKSRLHNWLGTMLNLCITSDGKYGISSSYDTLALRLWRVSDRALLQEFAYAMYNDECSYSRIRTCVALSPNEKYIVTGSANGEINVLANPIYLHRKRIMRRFFGSLLLKKELTPTHNETLSKLHAFMLTNPGLLNVIGSRIVSFFC